MLRDQIHLAKSCLNQLFVCIILNGLGFVKIAERLYNLCRSTIYQLAEELHKICQHIVDYLFSRLALIYISSHSVGKNSSFGWEDRPLI